VPQLRLLPLRLLDLQRTHFPCLNFHWLMSGTSLDAIDAALVDSRSLASSVGRTRHILPPSYAQLLDLCHGVSVNELRQSASLDVRLGRLFADAVHALLKKAGTQASVIRAIGSHGQTVRHEPYGEFPFSCRSAIRTPSRKAPASPRSLTSGAVTSPRAGKERHWCRPFMRRCSAPPMRIVSY